MAGRRFVETWQESVDVFGSLRPVLAKQAREGAIRQQPAACLTIRAVIRLVSRVTNALDLRAAARTWLAVTAVRSHVLPKRSDFFGKAFAGFFTQPRDPFHQRVACGAIKPRDFFVRKFLRQLHRRKARVPENLVRVSVTDAAEQSRIGERTFQRVVFRLKNAGEV